MTRRYSSLLSGDLQRRMLAYTSAAGAALALVPTAGAQIIYKDVNPDKVLAAPSTGGNSPDYVVDFDGDGLRDVQYRHRVGATFSVGYWFAVNTLGANDVVGYLGASDTAYASSLDLGAPIGPAGPFVQNLESPDTPGSFFFGFLAIFADGTPYGPWGESGSDDAYYGIRFRAGAGTTHYGWVRLGVDPLVSTVTIKDFAYQSTPNTPINAGDKGVIVATEPDALAEGFRFSPLAPNPTTGASSFDLVVGQPETVRVEAFDALGRSVAVLHDGPMAAGQTSRLTLDGGALPAGVYVVRASGESFVTSRRVSVVR